MLGAHAYITHARLFRPCVDAAVQQRRIDHGDSIQTADGSTGLYSIKLPTGKASLRGAFGSQPNVTDIAIPLNQL